MNRRTVPALVLVGLTACVTMPWTKEARDDAKGWITISTPLFVPLLGEAEDGKRLDFGDYRSEAKLIESIHKSQLGKTLLESKSFAGALSVALPTVEQLVTQEEYQNQGDRSNWTQHTTHGTTTTTSGTPPEGAPGQLPAVLGAVLDELMKRSPGVGQSLQPDQVASLVAAYKTYMVNLEEYTNLEGFDFDNPGASGYRPYKVHFTVSVEPGWYTRFHQYDAVARVTFGAGSRDCADYRVVTAAPAETAQTIDQLTGDFTRLALALEAKGTIDGVGVHALVQQLTEKAEKLEGLRSHKTMVVAFPKPGELRMRFRAAQVPTEEAQDLQPLTRLMTAVVMVPEPKPERRSSVESAKLAERAASLGGAELESLAQTKQELVASLAARTCRVTVKGAFEPALRDRGGDFRPRRTLLTLVPVVDRPIDRHELCSITYAVEIPAWAPDSLRSFEVIETQAIYYVKSSEVAKAAVEVARAEGEVKARKKDVATAIAKWEAAVKKAAKEKSQEPIAAEAKKRVGEAEKRVVTSEAKLERLATGYAEELAEAMSSGFVDVGYKIHSPRLRTLEGKPTLLAVQARVRGLGNGARSAQSPSGSWCKLQAGEQEGTLSFTGVDLTSVMFPEKQANTTKLRGLLEVQLVRADKKTVVVESETVELTIRPRIDMGSAPKKPDPKKSKPITLDLGSFDPEKLDLTGIEFEMKTAPKPKKPEPAGKDDASKKGEEAGAAGADEKEKEK